MFDQVQKMVSVIGTAGKRTLSSGTEGIRDLVSRRKAVVEPCPVRRGSDESEFRVVGYKPDIQAAPLEYYVRITSYATKSIVVGLLQGPISLSASGIWENFISTDVSGPVSNLVELISNYRVSLVTKASLRRKWKLSTPLSMEIVLKFEAVEDPYKEVVEPCKILQSLVLPSEGTNKYMPGQINFNLLKPKTWSEALKVTSLLPCVHPPGPSPYSLEDILNVDSDLISLYKRDAILSGKRGGDFITIGFGTFLYFENVILRKAAVQYEPRFDFKGNPISATVALDFESFEVLTKETLDRAYQMGSYFKTPEYEQSSLPGKQLIVRRVFDETK